MPSFKDNKNREWSIEITLGLAEEVDHSDFSTLTENKISILEPGKELFRALALDAKVTFAVIWVLVRDQAKEHFGIDPEESKENEAKCQKLFAKSIGGSTIDAGRKALFEALSDFFPERRIALSEYLNQIQGMRDAVEKETKDVAPLLTDYVTKKITERSKKLKEALLSQDTTKLMELEKILEREDGETSGLLQES